MTWLLMMSGSRRRDHRAVFREFAAHVAQFVSRRASR